MGAGAEWVELFITLTKGMGDGLLLVSGTSLCLTLGPTPTNNEVMLYRKGGHNRERNCCIPRISIPCVLY